MIRFGFRFKRIMFWLVLSGIPVALFLGFCQWMVLRADAGKLYTSAKAVPPRKVGLLLGTSEKLGNGTDNPFFTHRIAAAAELYKAGKVRQLLVSGDNSVKDYDEPAMMKRALMAAGVPETAITLDDAGFRTLDSVVRAKKVFQVDQLTLISQRFHNQRALFIADHYGVDAIGFCAKDVSVRFSIQTRVREVLARVKVVLDLYVLHTGPKFLGPPEPME